MNHPSTASLWERFTLQSLPLYQWRSASYVARAIGALQGWRSGSVLFQYGDAIALGFLAVLFGLAPYVSTTLISVLLVACISFWLLLTLAEEKGETVGWGLTPIHLGVMLYWGISTVAAGVSPVKTSALIGLGKLTLYLLLFVVMARVLRFEKWRSFLVSVCLLTALPVSYYGIWQYYAGVPPLATWSDPGSEAGNFTRAYSFLGNPNLLSSYLIPAVSYSLMAIFAWPGPIRKTLAVAMLGCNIACIMFTGSRGAGIGLVLMFGTLVLMIGFWLDWYRRKWVLPAIGAGLVGTLVVSLVLVPSLRNRVLTMFVGRGDSSNNYRINVWQSVLQMIKARPVLGIGPGDDAFKKMYPLYSRIGFTALSSYSVLLEIAVETGLVGLSCFVWLLLVTFTQAGVQLRKLRDGSNVQGFWLMGAVGSMVGLLGQGVVDTVWYRPQVNTLWWLAVAIVASFYSALPTDVRKAAPRLPELE